CNEPTKWLSRSRPGNSLPRRKYALKRSAQGRWRGEPESDVGRNIGRSESALAAQKTALPRLSVHRGRAARERHGRARQLRLSIAVADDFAESFHQRRQSHL